MNSILDDWCVLCIIAKFIHSRLITGFVARLTRRMPQMEQELHTLPEHLSSPPVFSGIRVTRSFVLCVCFIDRCLSFCTFSLDHCVVCSSSIYGFWLPLWYLQTLLIGVPTLCHNINPVLSSLMIYHHDCNKSNTTGAILGAETAYSAWGSCYSIFTFLCSVLNIIACLVCPSIDLRILITTSIYANF
jgi:hypothetical protein